mmetsp:Transcript_22659/g.53631  ORF Transcript_22659/g.53631 Transcript_22659/m.53631 type:complete len:107 (+) Transcript_22659:82-402(+)
MLLVVEPKLKSDGHSTPRLITPESSRPWASMDEMSNLTKTGMVLGGLAFGLGIEYLLRMKKAQEDQLKAAGTGGAAPATKATEASGSAAAVSKVVKAVVTVEYCGG